MGRPKHNGNEGIKLIGAANFYSLFVKKPRDQYNVNTLAHDSNLVMPRVLSFPSTTEKTTYNG